MEPKISSLTLLAQKQLGIQQAQSINKLGLMSDLVSQLTGVRGSQAELAKIYQAPALYLEGPSKDDENVHKSVRALLGSLASQTSKVSGAPESFRPFHSAFVNSSVASKNFRGIGATVVGGLLGGRGSDVAVKVHAVVEKWEHHQVASIFKPFCRVDPQTSLEDKSYLAEIRNARETSVADWIAKFGVQDWEAWTRVAEGLSIEEQMDSIATLAGLQLHRLLQIQLANSEDAGVLCLAPEIVNTAASTNIYAWYRHRVSVFLRDVAEAEVDRIAQAFPHLASFDQEVTRHKWCSGVLFESRSKKESEGFRSKFEATLQIEVSNWMKVTHGKTQIDKAAARAAIVTAYISTTRNLDKKIVSYFRDTGTIADIVGPLTARHKRHVMTPRLLSLLATLHVEREAAEIRTQETEAKSLPAFFDDLRARYGIVVAKSQARSRAEDWESMLPASLDENVMFIANSLERMGQLRRYSDHSAILV
jgi:hypothetical protein